MNWVIQSFFHCYIFATQPLPYQEVTYQKDPTDLCWQIKPPLAMLASHIIAAPQSWVESSWSLYQTLDTYSWLLYKSYPVFSQGIIKMVLPCFSRNLVNSSLPPPFLSALTTPHPTHLLTGYHSAPSCPSSLTSFMGAFLFQGPELAAVACSLVLQF